MVVLLKNGAKRDPSFTLDNQDLTEVRKRGKILPIFKPFGC